MVVHNIQHQMYIHFGHMIRKMIVTGLEGLDKHNCSQGKQSPVFFWGVGEFRILERIVSSFLVYEGRSVFT